jgi:hypothetical protein
MNERGSATAEVAILLPAIVLFLALVLAAGSGAIAQVRCVDAARTGARLAARGESAAVVTSAARAAAPAGADVHVDVGSSTAAVSVRASFAMPLPGVAPLQVHAMAVSQLEQALAQLPPNHVRTGAP